MIVLFSSLEAQGLYCSQIEMKLRDSLKDSRVIRIGEEKIPSDPFLSSYLLASLLPYIPKGSIVLALVGKDLFSEAEPILLDSRNHTFLGPSNGILEIVSRRLESPLWKSIEWHPVGRKVLFQGRDLFADIIIRLSKGLDCGLYSLMSNPHTASQLWPEDLDHIIYIDCTGSDMRLTSGLRGIKVDQSSSLVVLGHRFHYCQKMSLRQHSQSIWLVNSLGLVELITGVNICERIGIKLGEKVNILH